MEIILVFLASTADTAKEEPTLGVFLGSAALFIIVWQILSRFFFKPVFSVLTEREARTSGDEQKAHELHEETKTLLHHIESELRVSRMSGVKKRDEIVGRAKLKAAKIVEEAQAQAARELQAARDEITKLKESARRDLETEAEKLAVEAYCRLLNEDVSTTVH